MSRRECARPKWHHTMPTNGLQLDNPLRRYSAPVSLTMRSKSVRGMRVSLWLNRLHDAVTGGGSFG